MQCQGSPCWPDLPGHTLVVFQERSFGSEIGLQEQLRWPIAPGCLSEGWDLGSYSLGVMCPQVLSFREEWVVRITKWVPFHLGVSSFGGLLILQVFRLTWSPGSKGCWARLVGAGSTSPPYFVRAFKLSPTWRAYLSCSILRGLLCPFALSQGMDLPYLKMSLNAFNFNLSLGKIQFS